MTGTGNRRPASGFLLLFLLVLAASPARAWDPATTHAGLTEKAVLASSLHKVLSRRLGRPLGLLEPLQLHSRFMEPAARRAFWARLQALDPAGGYRPGAEGVASAMAWVVAGAVLAETPPERGRHHFLDPRTRSGLDDGSALAGFVHAVRLAFDEGANLRQIATGAAFDLTGRSSLDWIASPANDQSLPAVLDHLERAVAADGAAEREWSLVRALVALGGVLAVLEDAGEPAHVRNDFRGAFLRRRGSSAWSKTSEFERFVAARYGRSGVPAPKAAVRRPSLEAFFTAADGHGLADRSQRRFFSAGTIPHDVAIDARTTPREVMRAARESLEVPRPAVVDLDLREPGRPRYLMLEGRKTLGYVRLPERVRFFLDRAVYADAAHALLPEVAAYAAGMIDHLFRASLAIEAAAGRVTISVEGPIGAGERRLRLLAEDAQGRRRQIPTGAVTVAPGQPLTVDVPAGARRIAAVLRGADAAGPFVAAGEAATE